MCEGKHFSTIAANKITIKYEYGQKYQKQTLTVGPFDL